MLIATRPSSAGLQEVTSNYWSHNWTLDINTAVSKHDITMQAISISGFDSFEVHVLDNMERQHRLVLRDVVYVLNEAGKNP